MLDAHIVSIGSDAPCCKTGKRRQAGSNQGNQKGEGGMSVIEPVLHHGRGNYSINLHQFIKLEYNLPAFMR
jgi:Ca2+-binding RTX toxin-like protein